MPSKPENIYEYAVVRYVPKVEREEFINVGLLMMCKRKRWVRFAWTLADAKLDAMGSREAKDALTRQLEGFAAVAAGNGEAGPIAALPAEERFRWLAAVKSSCLQTSPTHPGLADDLESAFERLYAELVL